ncbi:ABC transporter substrate-binding protein [Streptomyces profundus]|uniref:ABC transporter substrate-binding protein n=1 Tax=Streptomyces profundus TaxID=2867410 RepID=UPI001D163788|nr:extracellular solute-binding protein [Streptomyces sp. MA3_2.13]UED83253.1 extracellular solute-binding protein [Streptomyces sp. MA3_2.13]
MKHTPPGPRSPGNGLSRRRLLAVGTLSAVLGPSLLSACATVGEFGEPSIGAGDIDPLGGRAAVDEMAELYRAAADEGESEIVVYGPVEDDRAPVYRTFEETFPGITVRTEVLQGPSLTARVNLEVASGRRAADLIQTGDTTMVALAETGRFQPNRPVTAAGLPDSVIDGEERFLGVSALPFVIAFNHDIVPADEAPRGWQELIDPRWRSMLVWDNPTAAGSALTTITHLLHDGRQDEAWLTAMAEQRLGLTPSAAGVSSAMATGEYPVAVSYPYGFYLSASAKGAPLTAVFPVDGGSHLSTHFLGLLDGAPHPRAARLLTAWLFSPRGQAALAEVGQYSLLPGAPPPDGLPPLDEIDRLAHLPADQAERYSRDTLQLTQRLFR